MNIKSKLLKMWRSKVAVTSHIVKTQSKGPKRTFLVTPSLSEWTSITGEV